MRKILYIFGLCVVLFVSTSQASITFPNNATSGSIVCNGACAAFPLGFTGSIGNVLLVLSYNSQNAFINAGNAGFGTWVFPANCAIFQGAGTGEVSCGYVILTSTVTSITMTMNIGSTVNTVLHVREYHSSIGNLIGETVPAATTSASCGASGNACNAPNVSLTGSNDVVVSGIVTGNSGCSVAAPYGNFTAPSGDGVADRLNTNSGTGAAFTQGTSCPTGANGAAGMVSIAFAEPVAAGNGFLLGGKFLFGGKALVGP